jgi:hypothetical protein
MNSRSGGGARGGGGFNRGIGSSATPTLAVFQLYRGVNKVYELISSGSYMKIVSIKYL